MTLSSQVPWLSRSAATTVAAAAAAAAAAAVVAAAAAVAIELVSISIPRNNCVAEKKLASGLTDPMTRFLQLLLLMMLWFLLLQLLFFVYEILFSKQPRWLVTKRPLDSGQDVGCLLPILEHNGQFIGRLQIETELFKICCTYT